MNFKYISIAQYNLFQSFMSLDEGWENDYNPELLHSVQEQIDYLNSFGMTEEFRTRLKKILQETIC